MIIEVLDQYIVNCNSECNFVCKNFCWKVEKQMKRQICSCFSDFIYYI